MNIVSRNRAKTTPNDRNGRHKPVRWFSLLMGIAVLAVSAAVVADVVIIYVANNTIQSGGTAPWQWVEGGNYGTANTEGFVVSTFTGPNSAGTPPSGYDVSNALKSISQVEVELVDVTEFSYSGTGTGIVANVGAGAPAAGIVNTNVGCDFAIVTTYAPASSGYYFSGSLTSGGCVAFAPNEGGGGLGNGCASGVGDVIDLTTGAIVDTFSLNGHGDVTAVTASAIDAIGGICDNAAGGAGPSLFVSYAIYLTGAINTAQDQGLIAVAASG